MADETITVNLDGRVFKDAADALAQIERGLTQGLKNSVKPVKRELMRALDKVADTLKDRHSTPWRPGRSPPGRLYKRSGKGIKGIVRSVKVSGSTLGAIKGRIGAKFPMSVHEKGATVRAKNAKFLTIPLPAALNSSGIALRKKARDWPNTFVAMSRNRNLIIFQKTAGGIVPLYLLKKQIKIPPRLGMEDVLKKEGLPFFQRRALDAIERELLAAT